MLWMQLRRGCAIVTASCLNECSVPLCSRKSTFTRTFTLAKKDKGILHISKVFYGAKGYCTDSNQLKENDTHHIAKKDRISVVQLIDEKSLGTSLEDGNWEKEMMWIQKQETKNVLMPPKDITEIDQLAPELRPTFNLAAYVNRSATLQEMVKLGVDISKWEKRKGISSFILKLEFHQDMKQHLLFLHDLGIKTEDLGRWLTINPLIFRESLEDLDSRVNYLKSMKFSEKQITRIALRNPNWLLFSSTRIDNRLGFFQRCFKLSGDEVRSLATAEPRLITYNLYHIKRTSIAVLEEMGFTEDERKSLILAKPKLWMMHGQTLLRRFDFAHNEMGLPHAQLTKFPNILMSREFRIKQRHKFLKVLGRDEYDPLKPNYVSPGALVEGDDIAFCENIAKSTIQDFNAFLKTL